MKKIFITLLLSAFIISGCGECVGNYEQYEIELWSIDIKSGDLNPVYTDWPSRGFERHYAIIGISNDGSQIYFVDDLSYAEIRRINLNPISENPLGVETSDRRAILSPDNQTIVYQNDDGEGEIWTVSSDGTNNTSLAINEIFNSTWNPVWLGDSNTILFSGYKEEDSGLYLFNINKESLQKLTSVTQRWRGSDITPDGSTLIYRVESNDSPILYKKDLSTNDSTQIGIAYRPILISPDGDHVVYSYDAALRYLNISTDQSMVLQEGWFDGNSVSFSSNGEKLIFENSKGLALIDITSLNKTILVYSEEFKGDINNWDSIYLDIETPTFTKDGNRIFFFVSRHKYSDGCPD